MAASFVILCFANWWPTAATTSADLSRSHQIHAASYSSTCSAIPTEVEEAYKLIFAVQQEPVSSHHAVLSVAAPPLNAGGNVVGEGYGKLPRMTGTNFLQPVFTKVVLVGHTESAPGQKSGLVVGHDVCGDASLVDEDAAEYLRSAAPMKLNKAAPKILDCGKGDCSGGSLPPSFTRQLPFLHALFDGRPGQESNPSKLMGNVLPVILQEQSIYLGLEAGDVLALLVDNGGPWQAEKVLFVFGGDMSHGLAAGVAQQVDANNSKLLTESGASNTASWFRDLQLGHGYGGKMAIPDGYSSLLAGSRVADIVDLPGTWYKTENSGQFATAQSTLADVTYVKGYEALVYWNDDRFIGMRMSNEASVPDNPGKPLAVSTLLNATSHKRLKALRGEKRWSSQREVQPHKTPVI